MSLQAALHQFEADVRAIKHRHAQENPHYNLGNDQANFNFVQGCLHGFQKYSTSNPVIQNLLNNIIDDLQEIRDNYNPEYRRLPEPSLRTLNTATQ